SGRARRGRRRRDGGRALGRSDDGGRRQVVGRVSRHAGRARAPTLAVLAVVLRVVEAPLLARLMPRVARALGGQSGRITVGLRAVDLPAVAALADHEDRLAPRAARLAPGLAFVLHAPAEDATISCRRPSCRAKVTRSGTRRVAPDRGLRLSPGPSCFPSSCRARTVPTRCPGPPVRGRFLRKPMAAY